MSWRPGHAAVISLPRSTDRRATLAERLAPMGFEVPVVDAVDGQTLTPLFGWQASLAARANALSHLHVLTTAPPGADVLVLEDDADVRPNFQEAMTAFMAEVPEDWQVLMLGGEHLAAEVHLSEHVTQTRYTTRTHGYVVRASFVPTVARLITTATTHWDHALARYMGWHHAYAPRPFLVDVMPFPSCIPDSVPCPRPSDRPL